MFLGVALLGVLFAAIWPLFGVMRMGESYEKHCRLSGYSVKG